MIQTSIKYSNVSRETLKAFISEENTEKISKKKHVIESIIRQLYDITAFVMYFVIIYFMSRPIWKFVKTLCPGNTSGDTFERILICSMVIIFGTYCYVKLIEKISLTIFPIYKSILMKRKMEEELKNLGEILELQEILKVENIEKIITDGNSTITVEYRGKNGININKHFDLHEKYFDVIREEFIDFSWLDVEINRILIKYKQSPIEVSSIC